MANRFWVGGSGTWNATSTANWAATSGGASGASAPTNVDNVTFDSNSGTSATVTVESTAVSLSTTVNKSDITLTLNGSPTLCTAAGTLTFTAGTLSLNSYTLTVGTFSSSNSNARTIAFGTGNITLTGNNKTIWTTATATGLVIAGTPIVNSTYSGSTGIRTLTPNFTGGTEANAISYSITAGSDTVTINSGVSVKTLNFTGFSGTLSNNSRTVYGDFTVSAEMIIAAGANSTAFAATSGTQTITTNGKTFDFPLTVNAPGATVTFADAITQGSTRNFIFAAGTLNFKNAVTSTVGNFLTSGTNRKYLQSTLAGSQATLSQASGTVNTSYLTITDISATGGATWNAFYSNNNVDAGNNTGWNFGGTPSVATEITYSLRSFTTPRRF